MKLATIYNGSPDGALVVVSKDGRRNVKVVDIAPTLQYALDHWNDAEPALRHIALRLEEDSDFGDAENVRYTAPLPRAWQWLDGSAFKSHGDLMEKALGVDPVPLTKPLMYQGMSHIFLGPTQDAVFMREDDDIDFEGEFGVIVDQTPMGVSAKNAMKHIRLIVQINDWSLRRLAGPEMRTGFGWVQAKPACSVAPFAVTPDELSDSWRDGRVCLDLRVDWNGERFGAANGGAMSVGFHDLIAHAAATRELCAGTIIGSGTVSNANFREVGSSCIAERRGIEIVDTGAPNTGFMKFGDEVRMEAQGSDGAFAVGVIEQR
ncbi:MAG: fumarylacetoacetate hydrolase family protein [Parvularculaceae bacterium]